MRKEFNFFEFLGIESKETIHSQFIASVLKEDKQFCHSFLSRLETPCDFQDLYKIDTEVQLLSRDKTNKKTYGRADILIWHDKIDKRIVIENKIYAGEQHLQIQKYYDYVTEKDKRTGIACRNGIVYFLTLENKVPRSAGQAEYKIIGYRNVIIPWLEKDVKDKCNPLLKSAIEQYIQTVKKLTKYQGYLEKNILLSDDRIKDKNKYKSFLEHYFWQKLESEINGKPDTKRKYSFDKIHRYNCNKGNPIERSYGLIYGNFRK